MQVVDCSDGNRFREIAPFQFFHGYRDSAHLPKFADSGSPADSDDEAAPACRLQTRRPAAKFARLADGSDTAGDANGAASRSDVPAIEVAAVERAPAGVVSAACQEGRQPVQPQTSTIDGAHEKAGVDAPAPAPTIAGSNGLAAAQSCGGLPKEAACLYSGTELGAPLAAGGCMPALAAQQMLRSAHAFASVAQAAEPWAAQRSDFACVTQGHPQAQACAQQPSVAESARCASWEPVHVSELPGLQAADLSRAASAAPAWSPGRRDGLAQSPSRSPGRRRQHTSGQQHMLKLKDFPPSAEFNRVMGRHNQVSCILACTSCTSCRALPEQFPHCDTDSSMQNHT